MLPHMKQMHTAGSLPILPFFFPSSLSNLLVAPTAKLEIPNMGGGSQAESVQAKSSMDGDPHPPLCYRILPSLLGPLLTG